MKKIVCLLMVLVMVLAFAACGAQGGDTAPAAGSEAEEAAAPAGSGETVKIICPYGAGGVADLAARKYAEVANKVQGDYNFIVENMTGGDGFAANTFFSEEDPMTKDLLVFGYGVCYRWDGAQKYDTEEVDFDVEKNVPFCTIDDRYYILCAKAGVTLADVLEKAKSDEGIKMSGGNPLSDPHLALATLIAGEGGKVQVIPYDGGAEQKKALTDGEVDVFVGGSPVLLADIEAGVLNPILAFSDKPFEGFVDADGNAISVPCIVGEGKAPELNADNDYSDSILPAGGGLATHDGCDPAFRDAMTEISKLVWADEDFSGWIDSVLLNNFQVYGDDAVAHYKEAREKGIAAYDLLLGE